MQAFLSGQRAESGRGRGRGHAAPSASAPPKMKGRGRSKKEDAASSDAASAAAEMKIKIGDKLKLTGLLGKPELNGREVCVVAYLADKDRWKCCLVETNPHEVTFVNAKIANLELLANLNPQRAKAQTAMPAVLTVLDDDDEGPDSAPRSKSATPARSGSPPRTRRRLSGKVASPIPQRASFSAAAVGPGRPLSSKSSQQATPQSSPKLSAKAAPESSPRLRFKAAPESSPKLSAKAAPAAPQKRAPAGALIGAAKSARLETPKVSPNLGPRTASSSSTAVPRPPEDSRKAAAEKPPAKQQKTNANTASSSSRDVPPETAKQTSKSDRTVEEIYQKKTQLEHILLRPDSYVGSMELHSQEHWVLADEPVVSDGGKRRRMERRKLEYVPALYKVYDEILVNAADHLIRDPSMDTIRVTIDRDKSLVSVWNNGKGLPVEIHKEHKCYVPEMVFGQLLTSDNYDDSEKKVVGGRNGYGAKLTNIFSRRFTIETADAERGRRYIQTWRDNMGRREEPNIKPHSSSDGSDFTCVTFEPDWRRFGMQGFDDDIVALMSRRAYDVAASTRGRCKIYLNGELLDVRSFEDYVSLYLEPDDFRVVETCGERWEVAIALTDGSGFQQVSFVNSICTTRGGTHVNYVADQLVPVLIERFQKGGKNGHLAVKPAHIRQYLWIFVNSLIENPCFDSQTKDTLTSKKDRFGSDCSLSEGTINAVLESGILDTLRQWSAALGQSELAKHLNKSDLGLRKRLFGIPKLEDANAAGTTRSGECTLIITEGDSAKSLAVAGLGIIGRDTYGVFPLRGKLRNVRDLTVKQMMDNKEIEQLSQILALDATKTYESAQGLRYGSLMIMTDQDYDGSHIKGLIINFIQHWFPGLLRIPGFLKEFVTPIVKVQRDDEVMTFFTISEYEAWREANNDGRGWQIKYYKGLGTSTSAEARDYFAALEEHELSFEHSGGDDDDLVDMAFNGKRADDRKEWMAAAVDDVVIDHTQPTLTYGDFVNKELVHFANYDVKRMIPSVVDGLKPGQRKVLYGCFKKKLSSDTKVAQLSGYIAEHSAYHHGESSLQGTIIGLAQTYIGSNNINLLVPSGQFGSRMQGGKDAAASRYIFTRLAPATRCLFPEPDDSVLEYQTEEGMKIEPRWYCPIIPLVLVNGADGIGVGWNTNIPNYNPRDIIANVRRHLRREQLVPMSPWYRGWKGSIQSGAKPGQYETCGVISKRSRVRVEITELPVRRWTQDYKEWVLEQLPQGGDEKRSTITEFREYHTENSVHFAITMTPDKLMQAEAKGLEKSFHLRSTISTTNMVLFDADGKIQKYSTAEEILEAHAKVRLDVYKQRLKHHIARMEREVASLSDRAKFILLVVSGALEVSNRPFKEVCRDIRSHGLRTKRELDALGPGNGDDERFQAKKEASDANKADAPADNGKDGYAYLLIMKLWTLTAEKVAELEKQLEQRNKSLDDLRKTTPEQLWDIDLQALELALDKQDAADQREQAESDRLSKKANKSGQVQENDEGMSNKQCVLVITKDSEIKRVRTQEWKAKRRGGRGQAVFRQEKKKAGGEDEEEIPDDAEQAIGEETGGNAIRGLFSCREFDALLAFTEHGYVFCLQALDVPLKRRMAPGQPVSELMPGLGGAGSHRIVAVVSVPQEALKAQKAHVDDGESIIIVSKEGLIKRISIAALGNQVKRASRSSKDEGWCQAFPLEKKGDEIVAAQRAFPSDLCVLASEGGLMLTFEVCKGFPKGCQSLRARPRPGMRQADDDTVVGLNIATLPPKEESEEEKKEKQEKQVRPCGPYSMWLATKTGTPGGWAEKGAIWKAMSEEEKRPFVEEVARLKAERNDRMAAIPKASPRPATPAKRKAVVDDDDSDADLPPVGDVDSSTALAKTAAVGDEDEVEEDEDEDEGDEDDGADEDVEDGETPAMSSSAPLSSEAAQKQQLVPAADDATTQALRRQAALLLTDAASGKRVRLSDFKIQKRGQKGRKCIGLKGDSVVAVHIVPDDEPPRYPRRPRDAWCLYQDQLTEEQRAAATPEAIEAGLPPIEGDATQKAFAGLSEAQQAIFNERHQTEVDAFNTAVELMKKAECELAKQLGQVLLCTKNGFVSRVNVAGVALAKKHTAGKKLMHLMDNDSLHSAAIVSAQDEDDQEEEGDSTVPAAIPDALVPIPIQAQ